MNIPMNMSPQILDWLAVAFYIGFAGFIIWQVLTRTSR